MTEQGKGQTFAEWLQARFDERGWGTLRQAEMYLGISRSSLSEYLSGGGYPNRKTLKRLAAFFITPLQDLAAMIPEPDTTPPLLVPEVPQPFGAGAGSFSELVHWPYQPKDYERGHRFIAVHVVGDCLEPRIHSGDRVIVDKDASPRNGDVVVVQIDGESLVKIYETRNGGIWLIALQKHEPVQVDESITIAGVVRMVMREP